MKVRKNHDRIKMSRFPVSLFFLFLGLLYLMSGIHVGLIVLMNEVGSPDIVQILVAMVYWAGVAAALTLFTRTKIRRAYEEPLHRIAQATGRVAKGDFSVYVSTLNTEDKWDYLDVMITDFNKMVEELGSIETLKTDFVSNVSHEMKTPIAVIKNYAELLQQEKILDELRKEYALSIKEAAGKLSVLITNILKLNRLNNQKIMPEYKIYDVSRQLCECILTFEDTLEEKKLQLETDLEERTLLEADENLLELVWNNLLSNAVKFSEPEGKIRVFQKTEDNMLKVAVEDSGCGMDSETLRHIFDKFYQGESSHAAEGNGLGLALVKRVLELLDGEIAVESEPGRGSCFTVTLPLNVSCETG